MELTFVIYPALLNILPFPQIWSAMFFLMLTWLGLGTIYVLIETISSLVYGTWNRRASFGRSKRFVTFSIWALILWINLLLFASSTGYYWLEIVDHYATSVNLVVSLFFQLVVIIYLLPITELAQKVSYFGETFPKVYLFPLRYLCPVFSLVLAGVAILNEFRNPKMSEYFLDQLVSICIFITPTVVMLAVAFWNPFGVDEEKEKEERELRLRDMFSDSE